MTRFTAATLLFLSCVPAVAAVSGTKTSNKGPGLTGLRFCHLSLNTLSGVLVSTGSNDEVHIGITEETALFYTFD